MESLRNSLHQQQQFWPNCTNGACAGHSWPSSVV